MLMLRHAQVLTLADAGWQAFERTTVQHIHEFFPVDAALLGAAGVRETVRCATLRAKSRGFDTFGDVGRYVDLALVLGSEFDADPLLPWAHEIVTSSASPPSKLVDLDDAAMEHLTEVEGEHGEHYTRALLRARQLQLEELASVSDLGSFLAKLHPTKLRRAETDGRWDAFVSQLEEHARSFGMDLVPGARPCIAAMMVLLGSGFATDPRWPFARAALDSTGSDERRLRALFVAAHRHLERALGLIRTMGDG